MDASPSDRSGSARLERTPLILDESLERSRSRVSRACQAGAGRPGSANGTGGCLNWQKHPGEALSILDRACNLDPTRSDCQMRRARTLQSLGRNHEARQAYRQVLAQDASSAEAKAALEQSGDLGR